MCRCRTGAGSRGRKLLGQPVDRRRGSRDNLADAGVGGRLDDFVGPVDQDLQGQPRLGGALRDPDGGLVEHHVHPAHQPSAPGPVSRMSPSTTRTRPEASACARFSRLAADEVVQDDDLVCASRDELVDDRGSDGAGSAGDQAALSFYHYVLSVIRQRARRSHPAPFPWCHHHQSFSLPHDGRQDQRLQVGHDGRPDPRGAVARPSRRSGWHVGPAVNGERHQLVHRHLIGTPRGRRPGLPATGPPTPASGARSRDSPAASGSTLATASRVRPRVPALTCLSVTRRSLSSSDMFFPCKR